MRKQNLNKHFLGLWALVVLMLFCGCADIVYITGSENSKATIEVGATGARTDLSGPFQYCSQPAGYEETVCSKAVEVTP